MNLEQDLFWTAIICTLQGLLILVQWWTIRTLKKQLEKANERLESLASTKAVGNQ